MVQGFHRTLAGVAGLTAIALAGVAGSAPARAQTVEDRLLRLERGMQNIERTVYTSDMVSLTGKSGDSVQVAQAGSYAVQDRMNGLERQMTVLTGQVEELQIKLQQLTTRLDKMTTDMEFRLSQLEGGAPPSANAAGGGQGPAPQSSAGPPPRGQPLSLPSTAPLTQPQNTQPQVAQPAPQGGVLRPPPPGQGYTPSVAPPPLGTQQAAAPAGGTVEQQYDAAQQMLRAGQYASAEGTLRDIVAKNPRHQLAPSAQYWLGETFYVRQDYQQAFADGYKN